jgi:SulP family sulfate permease
MDNKSNSLMGLRVPREVLTKDLVAGLVMSIVNVPGALANGLLAGINPIYGVYSMIAGTTVAALFTSSVIMNVDSTSATSIATGDFLAGFTSEEQQGYLVVLGILVGLWMLLFGILKLGFLVRFISNSVMTGFLSGLGVLTILGQVGDITGYYSDAPNKVFKTIDTLFQWQEIDPATLVLGILTIAIVVLISRTRFERYAFAVAVVGVTFLAFLPIFESVLLVGETTEIPHGLPKPNLPDLSLIPEMLLPALTIAIIALVQGAGVSQSAPNPDGEYPNPSGDFRGQGVANLSVGVFSGIPVGGSLGNTTMLQTIGGLSRWANIFTGIFAAVILVFFAPFIEILPLTALAGLLVVVGFSMIKFGRIETLWHTGPIPTTVFVVTFTATLFLDLQVAVAIGVILTFLLQIYRSAEKVRIERIIPQADGSYIEAELPTELPSGEIMVMQPIGSLFFAGTAEFEEHLLDVSETHHSVVILRLRDRDEVGSTFIRAVSRYANQLLAGDNLLMLVGISTHVWEQSEKTGLLDLIGRENVYRAESKYAASLDKALADANQWLVESTGKPKGE